MFLNFSKISFFQKTWFYHWIPLHLIAKTTSPGPGVPVPTLGSWNFFEFSCVFHVFKFPMFYITCRVLKLRFLALSRGPGGFRELREAGRNHFHLSWYLSDTGVTSYGQKPWGGFFSSGYVKWPAYVFKRGGPKAQSLKAPYFTIPGCLAGMEQSAGFVCLLYCKLQG